LNRQFRAPFIEQAQGSEFCRIIAFVGRPVAIDNGKVTVALGNPYAVRASEARGQQQDSSRCRGFQDGYSGRWFHVCSKCYNITVLI